MRNLTEKQRLYVACALDTEGTISLLKKRRKMKGMKNYRIHFYPRLKIGNSNDEFIQFVHDLTGGYIYRNISNKKKNPKWKVVKVIIVAQWKEIRDLLEQVIPYLIIKKKQGELLLEACKLHLPNFGRPVPYSKRMFEIQDEIIELNKKGRK